MKIIQHVNKKVQGFDEERLSFVSGTEEFILGLRAKKDDRPSD